MLQDDSTLAFLVERLSEDAGERARLRADLGPLVELLGGGAARHAPTTSSREIHALRLRSGIELARQERSGGGLLRRPRTRAPRDAVATVAGADAPHAFRRPRHDANVFDGGSKLNNERCRVGSGGRGKRHQNAPVRSMPRRGGGRLAKWTAPSRPARNHKARL